MEQLVRFWQGMLQRVGLKRADKILVGNSDDGTAQYVQLNDLLGPLNTDDLKPSATRLYLTVTERQKIESLISGISATQAAAAFYPRNSNPAGFLDALSEIAANKITGTLAANNIPELSAAKITAGLLNAARIPNLPASTISTGTFDIARIPDIPASKITGLMQQIGDFIPNNDRGAAEGVAPLDENSKLNASYIGDLDAAKIKTGKIALERLPEGYFGGGSQDLQGVTEQGAITDQLLTALGFKTIEGTGDILLDNGEVYELINLVLKSDFDSFSDFVASELDLKLKAGDLKTLNGQSLIIEPGIEELVVQNPIPNGKKGQKPYYILDQSSQLEAGDDDVSGFIVTSVEELNFIRGRGFDQSIFISNGRLISHAPSGKRPSPNNFPGFIDPDGTSASISENQFYAGDVWSYSPSANASTLNGNFGEFTGYVLDQSVGDYTMSGRMSSIKDDDDYIALIIAFLRDDNGFEHTLSVVRTFSTNALGKSYYLAYNFGQKNQKTLIDATASAPGSGKWAGQNTKVSVSRSGNNYTFGCSQFSGTNLEIDPATERTFSLDDFPETTIFKRPCQIGYGARSQQFAKVSEINIKGLSQIIVDITDPFDYAVYEYDQDSEDFQLKDYNYQDVLPTNRTVINPFTGKMFKVTQDFGIRKYGLEDIIVKEKTENLVKGLDDGIPSEYLKNRAGKSELAYIQNDGTTPEELSEVQKIITATATASNAVFNFSFDFPSNLGDWVCGFWLKKSDYQGGELRIHVTWASPSASKFATQDVPFANIGLSQGVVSNNQFNASWTIKAVNGDWFYIQFEPLSYDTAFPNYTNMQILPYRKGGTAVGVPYHIFHPTLVLGQKIDIDPYAVFVSNNTTVENSNLLFLPKKIETYVGDTLQLFKYAMTSIFNPSNYNIRVTSDRSQGLVFAGDDYPRYWQYTVTETGDFTITVRLFDNLGNLLESVDCTISAVARNAQPASNVNVLFMGDSLTFFNRLPDEFHRVLTSTDAASSNYNDLLNLNTVVKPAGMNYGNITLVGTQKINHLGWTGSQFHEGYSGKTWDWFANDAASPFTSSGAINFTSYKTANSISSIDVIYIGLGWNDIFKSMAEDSDVASISANAKKILRAIKAQMPDTKVYLWTENFPSLNGGSGNHPYGSSPLVNVQKWKIRLQNVFREYENICQSNEFSPFVKLIGTHVMFDSENMMQGGLSPKNIRVTDKELRGIDDVHPSDGGFFQIADALVRSFTNNHLT